MTSRGVAGRGFPFFFWPIVWGGAAGGAAEAYLHDSGEVNLHLYAHFSLQLANIIS